VQAIYQAFGRGDVATILDRLDDAVEWETAAPVSDVPFDATSQVRSYSFPTTVTSGSSMRRGRSLSSTTRSTPAAFHGL
jgi:hypothetical protein